MKTKTILLIAILLGMMEPTLSAQDTDPWVGEWTSETYNDVDWDATNATKDTKGNIQEVKYTDYRLVFRIAKNGDNHSVRAKTIKVNDSNYNKYHPKFTITRIEGNRMWLQASEQKRPFYSDGEIDEYCDLTWYYTLTLEDGAIHFIMYRQQSINYDRYMRYKDEDNWDTSTWTGMNLMLYNDNW